MNIQRSIYRSCNLTIHNLHSTNLQIYLLIFKKNIYVYIKIFFSISSSGSESGTEHGLGFSSELGSGLGVGFGLGLLDSDMILRRCLSRTCFLPSSQQTHVLFSFPPSLSFCALQCNVACSRLDTGVDASVDVGAGLFFLLLLHLQKKKKKKTNCVFLFLKFAIVLCFVLRVSYDVHSTIPHSYLPISYLLSLFSLFLLYSNSSRN